MSRNNETLRLIECCKKKIDDHDIIFFDIYDTLVSRDCKNPHDVFDIVEKKAREKYGIEDISNFKRKRINAELSWYRQNAIPTINQIYERIDCYGGQTAELLKKIEIETEIAITAPNYIGYELYQYARKLNRRIVAVSDMYLGSDTLRVILASCGYRIDDIIVSCEFGHDKKTSLLFNDAISKLGIKVEQVVHFGDNYNSDILGAEKAGIANCHIAKTEDKLSYYKPLKQQSAQTPYLSSFLNNRLPFIDDRIESIGYEVCGPMIVGFCQWLNAMITKEKYDRIFFCSRDAKQTFDIFKMMYPMHNDKVDYIYVSLKSLAAPYAASRNVSEKTEDYDQLGLIRNYFDQLGCKGKVAIVDSGYGGHTQGMLTSILEGKCELHGLYMRISKNFHKNVADVSSYPYMFQRKPEVKSYICGAFFETMISATHGRTNAYERNEEGFVVPVFGGENPAKDLLSRFQCGVMRFYNDWRKSLLCDEFIYGSSIESSFLNFAFFPEKKDVDAMMGITGGNESYGAIVIQKDRGYYRKHPICFFKDLKETYWKGGFLCSKLKSFYPVICRLYLFLDGLILNLVGF